MWSGFTEGKKKKKKKCKRSSLVLLPKLITETADEVILINTILEFTMHAS